MKIGVIDSGIGGLSTILAIDKVSSGHTYIYYYDKINLPYGGKTVEEMRRITLINAEVLVNLGAEIIVLACNTASTTSLEYIKQRLTIPCYGVIPPLSMIRERGNLQNHSTGIDFDSDTDSLLLCTQLTAKQLILRSSPSLNLIVLPQKELATLIEDNYPNFNCLHKKISIIFDGYRNISNIILGCTHYSFITPIIRELFPSANIYNGNDIVAQNVFDYITKSNNKLYGNDIVAQNVFDYIAKSNNKLYGNDNLTTSQSTNILLLQNGIQPSERISLLSRLRCLSTNIPCHYKE